MSKFWAWLDRVTNTKDFVEGCSAAVCCLVIFGVWFLAQWLLWF